MTSYTIYERPANNAYGLCYTVRNNLTGLLAGTFTRRSCAEEWVANSDGQMPKTGPKVQPEEKVLASQKSVTTSPNRVAHPG